MDLGESSPCPYGETYPGAMNIKVEELSDIEEEDDEPEVSLTFLFVHC
jgi:hypothetical protein